MILSYGNQLADDYASAGKLARASAHLGKLMAAALLVCEQRGRHRYYRLADDEVAHALEAVALIAERRTHTAAWANPTRQRLRFARCCYGYLAGKLLKALLAYCLQQGWLRRFDGERALEVTPLGRKHLAALLPSVNAL